MLCGMRRILVLLVLLAIAASTGAFAQTGSAALGVGAGFVVPPPAVDGGRDPAFAWGFHVNIPILSTLHLSPSSEIYRSGDTYATDNALSFKFMIPLSGWSPYFGVAPGLTAWGGDVSTHVGALGGVTVPLVSNLGAYAQYKYKVLFRDATNTRYSHVSAGLIFSF